MIRTLRLLNSVEERLSSARWVRTRLGPWPKAREIQVACASILAIALLLAGLSVGFGFRDRPIFGHEVGGDFLAWYVAGTILNEHSHARLYDLALEHQLQHQIRKRWANDLLLAYANAPWLAVLFQPLARLPYIWAYIAWLIISALLYVVGLELIWPRGEPFDGFRATYRLIALSFFPFSFECWFGGQLAAIGFFAISVCLFLIRRRHQYSAGAVLGLCTYKPTLLLLLLPMLMVGRRYRALFGFCMSSGILVMGSAMTVGYQGLAGYIQTLMLYGRVVSSGGSTQQLAKYVDLNAFMRLVLGGPTLAGFAAFACLALATIAGLGWAWLRSDQCDESSEGLLWAITLGWTLLINGYVPIYDSVLIVPCAVMIASMLYSRMSLPHPRPRTTFQLTLVFIYLTAFATQSFASEFHVQVMTFGLGALSAIASLLWVGEQRERSTDHLAKITASSSE